MGEAGGSADHVIAELLEMGFELPIISRALKAVGTRLDDAIEFILKDSSENDAASVSSRQSSDANNLLACNKNKFGDTLQCQSRVKQSSIIGHLQSSCKMKKWTPPRLVGTSFSNNLKTENLEQIKFSPSDSTFKSTPSPQSLKQDVKTYIHPLKVESSSLENGSSHRQAFFQSGFLRAQEIEPDWENKLSLILQKHFEFSSLKSFQKEAVEAWLCRKDCLVLAATGSGKSLCFQIPALLTKKVVVVISPLISLMHDQCLKLAKHGISACFLGSGQPDKSVESKAIHGLYDIVYVCPETVLRLLVPLQKLAENRGIALFAIDEAHCVSKWGHDFRPDYRRLSVFRENFTASKLKLLEFDIPLMALTATATIPVRKDIIESLHMSEETKIVLTSFFRPNLRFSVKSSRCTKSYYHCDFRDLVEFYSKSHMIGKKHNDTFSNHQEGVSHNARSLIHGKTCDIDIGLPEDKFDRNNIEVDSEDDDTVMSKDQMTVEFLEDELDYHKVVDDFDVTSGDFSGLLSDFSSENKLYGVSEIIHELSEKSEDLRSPTKPLNYGPTIIYVPTRKETLFIVEFLSRSGIRAAAYHAGLPKSHLRRVHEEFHQNILQIVVATVAFGMGIDKSNVRKIIHYGWPQSLEAYYQEAGRAGRDGRLSDCTLYANLARVPSLLPNKRSAEQSRQAYKMLSDCFRYGMSTATCRAKMLVNYFGENFGDDRCHVCDICINGPPEMRNLREEADVLLQVLAEGNASRNEENFTVCDSYTEARNDGFELKLNFRAVVSTIRQKSQKFSASDKLWWQGLARILEDKRYIREADDMTHICIKFPEITDLGLKFLKSSEEPLLEYPGADMLLSLSMQRKSPYSTFSEWGRGWADPEIRRQRLGRNRVQTRKRRRSRNSLETRGTVRGRLSAKLSKK